MTKPKPHLNLVCPICSEEFLQHRADQKYCSIRCRNASARIKLTEYAKERNRASIREWQNRNRKLYYTPEKRAYYAARHRCMNPRSSKYQDYGARGIEFRFNSLRQFIAALGGNRPSSNYVLDRIDNNGHYESGNVKWSTKAESNRNRRKQFRNRGKPIPWLNS